MKLSDLIDFNPRRHLEKGRVSPFIGMADISERDRDVLEVGNRTFNGSGSRFKNGDTLFARITPCLENGKTAKVSSLPDDAAGHGSTEFIVMAAKILASMKILSTTLRDIVIFVPMRRAGWKEHLDGSESLGKRLQITKFQTSPIASDAE